MLSVTRHSAREAAPLTLVDGAVADSAVRVMGSLGSPGELSPDLHCVSIDQLLIGKTLILVSF